MLSWVSVGLKPGGPAAGPWPEVQSAGEGPPSSPPVERPTPSTHAATFATVPGPGGRARCRPGGPIPAPPRADPTSATAPGAPASGVVATRPCPVALDGSGPSTYFGTCVGRRACTARPRAVGVTRVTYGVLDRRSASRARPGACRRGSCRGSLPGHRCRHVNRRGFR